MELMTLIILWSVDTNYFSLNLERGICNITCFDDTSVLNLYFKMHSNINVFA